MYATVSFTHFELTVAKGDELPDDHPMVAARPDLFTATKPPTPPKASKARKENDQ